MSKKSLSFPHIISSFKFSSVQSLSHVWLFAAPWTVAHQIQVQSHHLFLIISCLFGEHFKVWLFEYFKNWFKFFLQSSWFPWIVSLVYFFKHGTYLMTKGLTTQLLSINWGIIVSGLNKSDRKSLYQYIWGKNHTSKDTCTSMFTATLFTIAKTWKQPKCPSIKEWL